MKKLLAKLINWEAPRGVHKPSADEIFRREQKSASEIAKEDEKRRKVNIEESQWEEVKLPDGTEQNPK